MINKRPLTQGPVTDFAAVTRRLTELQAAHKQLIDEVHYGRRPQASSELLEDIVLAIGNNNIAHGLGRRLRGWKQVRGANLGVVEVSADDKLLVLSATTAGTISLEVY